MTEMEGIEHRTVQVNGINMHIAEKGQGPLILFVHGFPELWYSWRHQITALASLGYRAVAPDLRGFGDTDAPDSPTSYTCLHVVGDLIALLDAIAPDQDKVFVVGHDWGAYLAWFLCLFRPDRVKALVNLSVAFMPRNPQRKFIESVKAVYGDDYYMCRFQIAVRGYGTYTQYEHFEIHHLLGHHDPLSGSNEWYFEDFVLEPGVMEAEFAKLGTARVMKEILTYRNPGPLFLPKDKMFGHAPDASIVLPSWLSEDEVNYYASKFEKTGFTGALNYYRNLDLSWELTAAWTEVQVKVPVKFIVGDQDLVYNSLHAKDFIHKGGFKKYVPLLEEVVVMEGVAHFINQEKPDEISKHIHDFIVKFH